MPREGQTSVTLREEVVAEIESTLGDEPRSVAAFVTAAIQEKLERQNRRQRKEGGPVV